MNTPTPGSTDKPEGFDQRLDAIGSRFLKEFPPVEEVESIYEQFVINENWPPAGDARDVAVAKWVSDFARAKEAMTNLALIASGHTGKQLTSELVSASIRAWPWYLLFAFLCFFFLQLGLNFWLAIIAATATNGAAFYSWTRYKQRKYDALSIDDRRAELERLRTEEAAAKRKTRMVVIAALTVLLALSMFLAATNPRVDAFRSFADSKGYLFPSVREKNFVLFTLFRIQGISGESHLYLGAFNQFFELE